MSKNFQRLVTEIQLDPGPARLSRPDEADATRDRLEKIWRLEFEADVGLQDEFGTLAAYIAYCRAKAAGLVKILR